MNINDLDFLKAIISEYKPKDLTCNGKCTKCGECCSNILPISQNEMNIIKKYVIENDIKPAKSLLVMQQKMMCPYFNGKKCLIYEARPWICKEFYCNKMPAMYKSNDFLKEKRYTINMWNFANEVEKQRMEINN